jgi:hypothetical protein
LETGTQKFDKFDLFSNLESMKHEIVCGSYGGENFEINMLNNFKIINKRMNKIILH